MLYLHWSQNLEGIISRIPGKTLRPKSYLGKYIFSPVSNYLLRSWFKKLHPNYITGIAFIVEYVLLFIYLRNSPNFFIRHLDITVALAFFGLIYLNCLLDMMDGSQARTRQLGSVKGELLDHGKDHYFSITAYFLLASSFLYERWALLIVTPLFLIAPVIQLKQVQFVPEFRPEANDEAITLVGSLFVVKSLFESATNFDIALYVQACVIVVAVLQSLAFIYFAVKYLRNDPNWLPFLPTVLLYILEAMACAYKLSSRPSCGFRMFMYAYFGGWFSSEFLKQRFNIEMKSTRSHYNLPGTVLIVAALCPHDAMQNRVDEAAWVVALLYAFISISSFGAVNRYFERNKTASDRYTGRAIVIEP